MFWITAWWIKTNIIWSAGYVGRELRAAVPIQCILILFNFFGLIFYSKINEISLWSLVKEYYIFLTMLVASTVCVSVVKFLAMLDRNLGVQYHKRNLKIGLSFIVSMVMGIYVVLLFFSPYAEIIVLCIAYCNILTILIYNFFIKKSMLQIERNNAFILRYNVIITQSATAFMVLYVKIFNRRWHQKKFKTEDNMVYILLIFVYLCFTLILYSSLSADLLLIMMGGFEKPLQPENDLTCSDCLAAMSEISERRRVRKVGDQPEQTIDEDCIVYEVHFQKMSCFLADWKARYFSKLEQLDLKQVSGRDFFRAIPFCILIILTRFIPLASSEFSEEFLMELVDPFQFSATIMVVSWFSEKIVIQKMLLGTSEAELFGLYSTSLLVAHGATALTVFSVTHALIMEGPSSNNFVFSIITMSLFTVFFWFLHIQEYPLTLKRENPWKALVILQRICFFMVFCYCFYFTFFGDTSYDPEFSPEYVMYLKVRAIIITGATLLYFSKIYSPISADFVLLLIGRLENKKVELRPEMTEAPRSAPQKNKKRQDRKVSFRHEE